VQTATPTPSPEPSPKPTEQQPAVQELKPVEASKEPEQEAAPLDPDEEFARLMRLGRSSLNNDRFKSALVNYRKALALKPDSRDAKAGVGIALVNTDPGPAGYREATRLLEEATRLDSSNARAWLALGMAYQFTAQNPKAIAAYKKYLFLEPTGQASGDVRAMLKQLGE
jgi:cytochrome c-type biogenesis protein CcmH/NrfG